MTYHILPFVFRGFLDCEPLFLSYIKVFLTANSSFCLIYIWAADGRRIYVYTLLRGWFQLLILICLPSDGAALDLHSYAKHPAWEHHHRTCGSLAATQWRNWNLAPEGGLPKCSQAHATLLTIQARMNTFGLNTSFVAGQNRIGTVTTSGCRLNSKRKQMFLPKPQHMSRTFRFAKNDRITTIGLTDG